MAIAQGDYMIVSHILRKRRNITNAYFYSLASCLIRQRCEHRGMKIKLEDTLLDVDRKLK